MSSFSITAKSPNSQNSAQAESATTQSTVQNFNQVALDTLSQNSQQTVKHVIKPNQLVRFATCSTFDKDKLRADDAVQRTVPGKTDKYWEIPLLYNYGTPECPVIDTFQFQGPKMRAMSGIKKDEEKKDETQQNNQQNQSNQQNNQVQQNNQSNQQGGQGQQKKKESFSTLVKFPQEDPVNVEFVEAMKKVHLATAGLIWLQRFKVGQPKFNKEDPEASLYKSPVYFPIDKTTGEIIKGKAPSMWIKLLKKGSGVFEEKTIFRHINQTEIEWDLLIGSDIEFIPIFSIATVYLSAKPSIQIKLKEALVIRVEKRNSQSLQASTANEYASQNPGSEDALDVMIRRLRDARLVTVNPQEQNQPLAQNQQTGQNSDNQQKDPILSATSPVSTEQNLFSVMNSMSNSGVPSSSFQFK